MRCGILTVDRTGRLLLLNDLARQILEIGDEGSPGQDVREVLVDHPQLAQILVESFSMTTLPNRAEIDLRCRSQKGKTIGFTLSMVPGPDGAPEGAAIFFKDLTYVEHREEQERLRDRLAALGQMAANLAHEIRNPLASIEVTCSLLKRRLPPEPAARDLLDKIVAEVRRLNRTITSSLEFVRPLTLSLTTARIETVLDEAITVAKGRRGRPEIRVERKYAPSLPAFLMDPTQVRQVFENLLINAMEAVGEAGMVTVESDVTLAPAATSIPYRPSERPAFDRYVVVRVRDDGPGIPEDVQAKLFYPFYTTKKQGSGVGLSMARKIVDCHRGLIDVDSRPGQGATFTVRLPMVQAQEAASV
jgi:signal transduction histidine kinase